MLTVYCEKLGNTGLNAPLIGLIGIVIGAAIGLCTAYFTQRWQFKNLTSLEERKNRIKFFTDYALNDLLKYIDQEVDFIQRIYSSQYGVYEEEKDYDGIHRYELAKYMTMLPLLSDEVLDEQFRSLLGFRDKLKFVSNDSAKKDVTEQLDEIIGEAIEIAGQIKLALITNCISK